MFGSVLVVVWCHRDAGYRVMSKNVSDYYVRIGTVTFSLPSLVLSFEYVYKYPSSLYVLFTLLRSYDLRSHI